MCPPSSWCRRRAPPVDAGPALPGVLELLEDEEAGALGKDEPVAIAIEGPAGRAGSLLRVLRACMAPKAATLRSVPAASLPR